MDRAKAIGVFDSGVGGIPVLARAAKALPHENFIYYADTAHFPYGDNDPATIKKGVFSAVEEMDTIGIKAVVIACNTATSIAIADLRKTYKFPILGMEPAIKPAAEHSRGKRVAVIATALTLREDKFRDLLNRCEHKENIIAVPASGLADLVEKGDYNNDKGRDFCKALLKDVGDVDIIVLGCTHYLYLLPLLREFYPKAEIIDGGEGTVKNLCRILEEEQLCAEKNEGKITVLSSKKEIFVPKFAAFYEAIKEII